MSNLQHLSTQKMRQIRDSPWSNTSKPSDYHSPIYVYLYNYNSRVTYQIEPKYFTVTLTRTDVNRFVIKIPFFSQWHQNIHRSSSEELRILVFLSLCPYFDYTHTQGSVHGFGSPPSSWWLDSLPSLQPSTDECYSTTLPSLFFTWKTLWLRISCQTSWKTADGTCF